jgi:hypothetical protein
MLQHQLHSIFLFLTRTIILILLLCSLAEAQISAAPLIIEDMTVYPGGLKTFFLVVGSRSKETQDCTLSLTAMALESTGLPVPVDNSPRSCHEWITMTPETFVLPPAAAGVSYVR